VFYTSTEVYSSILYQYRDILVYYTSIEIYYCTICSTLYILD